MARSLAAGVLAASRRTDRTVLRDDDGEVLEAGTTSVVLLDDDRIALVERYSQELRVYDSLGRLVGRMGGKGQGPGEFVSANAMFRAGGDSVVVWDSYQRRLTVYDTKTRSARTEAQDEASALGNRVPADPPTVGDARRSANAGITRPTPRDEGRGDAWLVGRFDDGAFVWLERGAQSFGSPRGDTLNVESRAVRAGHGPDARRLELPPAHSITVAAGAAAIPIGADREAVRMLAVCDRGVIVLVDTVATVFDRKFRRIRTAHVALTPRDAAGDVDREIELLRERIPPGAQRDDAVRRVRALLPKRSIAYFPPNLDADGDLWLAIPAADGGQRFPHAQAFARVTLDGQPLDSVSIGAFESFALATARFAITTRLAIDTITGGTVLYHLPPKPTPPPSPAPSLGRCSSLSSF